MRKEDLLAPSGTNIRKLLKGKFRMKLEDDREIAATLNGKLRRFRCGYFRRFRGGNAQIVSHVPQRLNRPITEQIAQQTRNQAEAIRRTRRGVGSKPAVITCRDSWPFLTHNGHYERS